LDERLLHILEIQKRSGTEMPWLCDTMDGQLKSSLDAAPNGEYIFDPNGKLIRKRFWSDPDTLRADLDSLVGKSEKTTRVEDLPTVFKVEKRKIASGVVPRMDLPAGLSPLVVSPVDEESEKKTPYYVKLRAELERQAFQKGNGKLYLGFYLDPLYKVHWNNESGVVKVSIESSIVDDKSKSLRGPKVTEKADIDPRQFLVEVDGAKPNDKIMVSIRYTICDDAETFCVPVTQKYEINLKPDRNGGSRPGVFMPAMFANVRDMDKNKDGVLTIDELPKGRTSLYIGHMDKNNDKKIDKSEIDEFLMMFNDGRGFDSNRNDGRKKK